MSGEPSEPPWEQRLAVRVTSDAKRQIRGGHPWVFDRSVKSVKPQGRPGDLAVVFDDNRRFVAVGLYDPTSPLRIRILHQGKPKTIDGDWLASAIAAATARRPSLLDNDATDAYRLVHGENDGLPGLVIDKYGANLVIKIYTRAWLSWLPYLVTATLAGTRVAFGPEQQAERVVLRLSRNVSTEAKGEQVGDGVVVHGPALDGDVAFTENGLAFSADLARGHKTGHFLDQRDNRQLLADHTDGRTVLDVFACTGGFSVNAARGGATEVTSVDLSRPALRLAESNMARNADLVGDCHYRTIVGDAFDVMADLAKQGRRFDVVVVDPPAFAQRQQQTDGALRAYQRLAALAARLINPGGLLLQASCSSRIDEASFVEAVRSGIGEASRVASEVARMGQPEDHPVGFANGRYLKATLLQLD